MTIDPAVRLFQLISPSLPVGAYAYSQGIEWAVEAGWIRDGADLTGWLRGLLGDALARVDLPLLLRQHQAWQQGDVATVDRWNAVLLACRESAELRAEEHNRGRALAALLQELGIRVPGGDWSTVRPTQIAGFALAAATWGIPARDAALGYAWSWLENQVLGGVKAIPLGQSAGQRMLLALAQALPAAVDRALALPDEEIGACNPALAIASSRHETQYTRLFRS
jgi:urease accessory protein